MAAEPRSADSTGPVGGPRRQAVLLSYYYPPGPQVGGLRAAKVARALRDAGYRVLVLTVTGSAGAAERDIDVQRIVPWRNPRHWYLDRRREKQHGTTGSSGSPAESPAQRYTIPPRVPLWKRFIFSLLWLPDDQQGFVPAAARAARRAGLGRSTVVFTSAPPFSAHLAGLWLQWRHRVRWVADFRDPWTDNPWKPWHVRTRVSDAVDRMLERLVLRRADRVVTASEGIADRLRPKTGPRPGRLAVIRNGIDTLRPIRSVRVHGGPARIVHVGSFYHGRDPQPFFRALSEVRKERSLGPGDVRVELVGNCRWFSGRSVEEEARTLGVDDLVQFRDWVPHEEARRLVEEADILLLLAQNQPDQVPNKLYEYLGTRRPILAFVDDTGESARLLREVGGHQLVAGDNPDGAALALSTALGLEAQTATGPQREDVLRTWTTEHQMRRLVETLEGIFQ